MGFGMLFFGYFTAFLMSVNSYGFLFSLIGYYVMFVALQKLAEYKHSLSMCFPPLGIMALYSLAEAARFILEYLQISSFLSSDIVTAVVSTLALVASVGFHVLLFSSLIELAQDTELPEIKSLAKTNIFMIAAYFIANLAAMLLKSVWNISNQYLSLSVILLRILFPVFSLALIYKCFYKICAPEDADVPVRPPRFKFINNLMAREEQRDNKTFMDKTQSVYEEEAKKNRKKK